MRFERRLRAAGYLVIAGVDEVGVGPLAGPVCAAAAILPPQFKHAVLDDSKKLTAAQREGIYAELTTDERVRWCCATVEVEEINRLNILQAAWVAMRHAILGLAQPPDAALIDGRPVHPFPVHQHPLVGGDALSLSIAAASVIAKVTRDRLMGELAARHPEYGFAEHKGYGTPQHLAALRRHGPCPAHRRTFRPVAQCAAITTPA